MKYRIVFKHARYWPQYRKWYNFEWKYMFQVSEFLTAKNSFIYKYVNKKDAKARIAKFKSNNAK